MAFNIGSSSHISSSTSLSSLSDGDDDDEVYQTMVQDIDREQEAVVNMISTNNLFLGYQLNRRQKNPRRGGSVPGHIVINREREKADRNLFNDYFAANPRFNESMFRRRFRMSRDLFVRVLEAVENHDPFFTQKRDGLGRLGLSPYKKFTAVFRVLAYGVAADATDEYVKIGESTVIESLKRFCRAVIEIFAERYLRAPNANDIERLLYIGKKRGFPGMLGSLDCMHWRWKNCPTGWVGQYSGRSGHPTIILEAVADYDLWFWHAFFGLPGSNNDINILEASHLFANLANGVAPPARYVIRGKGYEQGYYLADGIYPKWSTIVQTIHAPSDPKRRLFAAKQEACRKDVERAFGVLQSRFAIVAGPVRYWKKQHLHDILTTCIILHNMIIEDERDIAAPIGDSIEAPHPEVDMVGDEDARFQDFLARHRKIKDRNAHFALREALVDHLWDEHGNTSI